MTFNTYTAKIRYDPEFDLLSVRRPGYKTTYVVTIGSINLEFYNNQVIGFNLGNAKTFLESITGRTVAREQLAQVSKGKIGLGVVNNSLIMLIVFTLPNAETLQARYALPLVSRNVLAVTA